MVKDVLTYGSLFSGVGLLDLGVEKAFEDAGIPLQCAWQCEWDPWCRRVLAKHWPEVVRYDDVRGEDFPHADILVGGFPCQDLSTAGKQVGLSGSRSGLWFEYLRIIERIRPRAVIVENVVGLLSGGLDTVVEGLDRLGYSVEATRIRASDLGASHHRERVFLLAYPDEVPSRPERDATRAGETTGSRGQLRGELSALAGGGQSEPGMGRGAHGSTDWLDGHRWPARRGLDQEAWEPSRTAEGVPEQTRRLQALGNAVVPQCAYVAARRLIERLYPERRQPWGGSLAKTPGEHVVVLGGDDGGLAARQAGLVVKDSIQIVTSRGTLVAWLAQAPRIGGITENAINFGEGLLDVDHNRLCTTDDLGRMNKSGSNGQFNASGGPSRATHDPIAASGRWPTNLLFVHDDACGVDCVSSCPVARLDAQALVKGSLGAGRGSKTDDSASRFFPSFANVREAVTWLSSMVGG